MGRKGGHVRGRRFGWGTLLLVLTGLLVFGGAGAAFAGYRYESHRSARILPGIRIQGVDVGGMTADEALRALDPVVRSMLGRPITVTAAGRSWSLTARSLGERVDASVAVGRALAASQAYGWPTRLYHRLLDRPVPGAFQLRPTYDGTFIRAFAGKIAAEVRRDPSDASLDFTGGRLVRRHATSGRRLRRTQAEARLGTAVRDGASAVALSIRTIAPTVRDNQVGTTIVVRISQNELYLYDGLDLVKKYPVATGQLGVFDTPQGHFEIVNKRINPTWVNPATTTWGKDEPAVIPPGPDNPLGTRAMDLSAPGIRIHGTPDDASIGHWASHGCVRMHIADAEDLFDRVEVGTTVIIAW